MKKNFNKILLCVSLFPLLFGCTSTSENVDTFLAPEAIEVPEGFRVVTIGISGPPMEVVNMDRTWPATLVQYQDKYFLVDCGGGATHGLVKAGILPSEVKNMLN